VDRFRYLYIKEMKENWSNYLALAIGVLVMGLFLSWAPKTVLPVIHSQDEVTSMILGIFIPIISCVLAYRSFSREWQTNTIYYLFNLPVGRFSIAAVKFLSVMTWALWAVVFFLISQSNLFSGVIMHLSQMLKMSQLVLILAMMFIYYSTFINIGLLLALKDKLQEKVLTIIVLGIYIVTLYSTLEKNLEYSILTSLVFTVVLFALIIRQMQSLEVDKSTWGFKSGKDKKISMTVSPKFIAIALIFIMVIAGVTNYQYRRYRNFNIEINPTLEEFSWSQMFNVIEGRLEKHYNITESFLTIGLWGYGALRFNDEGKILDVNLTLAIQQKKDAGKEDIFYIDGFNQENNNVRVRHIKTNDKGDDTEIERYGYVRIKAQGLFESMDKIPWGELLPKLNEEPEYSIYVYNKWSTEYIRLDWRKMLDNGAIDELYLVKTDGSLIRLDNQLDIIKEINMAGIYIDEIWSSDDIYSTVILLEIEDI
jgi:ABC-type transport system involved in multi-copper enzyme maturation permease subunit